MNIPNDTRLKYDSGSYQEELTRSIFPGIYQLNSPYNDCGDCGALIPDDPFMRYQSYGQNTCTMKKAIDDKVLCKYYYYPVIVELENEELIEYRAITNKLIKFLDPATGRYKDDPYVNMLLIKRKNIIHKANQKSNCLLDIVDKIGKDNFKYAFIYVPEGFEPNYDEILQAVQFN